MDCRRHNRSRAIDNCSRVNNYCTEYLERDQKLTSRIEPIQEHCNRNFTGVVWYCRMALH